MKLPNADRAFVDINKIKNYCLSFAHLRGRHKAKVFQSLLGLTEDDAEELKEKFLKIATREECQVGEKDKYGQRFILDFKYERNSSKAMVRSTWIIKTNEDFPRLTSCYIL